MYINTETNQYPVSEQQIRNENPNTSFSSPFVPPAEYQWVFPSPQPTYDPMTQSVREIAPALNALGKYEQKWEIVDLSPEQMAANLDAKKAQMVAVVNARRDSAEEGSFTYLGKQFDSDSRSVQRINTAVQAAQVALAASMPFQLEWMCADNTTLNLDAQQMLGVPVALATHANAVHLNGRSLKNAIISATTAAELAAIDIESGWPAV